MIVVDHFLVPPGAEERLFDIDGFAFATGFEGGESLLFAFPRFATFLFGGVFAGLVGEDVGFCGGLFGRFGAEVSK